MGQPDSRVLLLWDGTESANRNARPRYPAKPGRFGCNIESADLLPVLQPHEGGTAAGGIARVGCSHRGDRSGDLKPRPRRRFGGGFPTGVTDTRNRLFTPVYTGFGKW